MTEQPTQKRGLGRGLSSLMGDFEIAPSSTGKSSKALDETTTLKSTATVAHEQLRPGRFQPRRHFADDALQELAESIKKNGLLQPLIARPIDNDRYEIIAGERRWRASKVAGLTDIPVIIRHMDDREALAVGLLENIQRQDLSPIEEAEGYQRLMDEFSFTQEALASELGKSRSHIANLLRLLSLPSDVKSYVNEGKISMGHARAIIGSENPKALAQLIIHKKLSVREAEKLAKGWGARQKALIPAPGAAPTSPLTPSKDTQFASLHTPLSAEKDDDVIALEQSLSNSIGLRVEIDDTEENTGGRVTLHFDTLAELDHIIQALQPRQVRHKEPVLAEEGAPSVRPL